ncbi:hypothetical protein RB620_20505 [Paenibacillus sp. LHD-117]|uniref:hypothetical protein n=1 Tax=Paenibacillus sp. LHD-117 TaxID=3071412 RepID=UPI0027E00A61|nr:hypothetical protein [Paenibacillus sp. LHD-117]MDQ6421813.1 hypothetical protein [Paenibacillus sp. LHD-117]
MFDPTVFENLKVALENGLYDLDNLDRAIDIVGRRDLLDMAVFSRELSLSFRLAGGGSATAELLLRATLKELAAEILEQPGAAPTCRLRLRFHLESDGADDTCETVGRCLLSIWQPAEPPVQTLSRDYGVGGNRWRHTAELDFGRGIGEEQMEDLPELLEHMLLTLSELDRLAKPGGA